MFEQVARGTRSSLADRIREDLERLPRRLAAGERARDVIARAGDLARMRAYVTPASEIDAEGRRRIRELEEWGVPADVLARLASWVPDLASADEGAARVALHSIYEQVDYWDWYVEVYGDSRRKIRIAMLAVILAALAGATLLFVNHYIYAGIISAGVAGAGAGIMAKLPRVITATMMGSGLLASDIVAVRGKLGNQPRSL